MNEFLDSTPVAVVVTVASLGWLGLVFFRTHRRDRFLDGLRIARERAERLDRPEPARLDRIALVLRQALPVFSPAVIVVAWSSYGEPGQTIGLVVGCASALYIYWRAGRDRPPRFLMPRWFREQPEVWQRHEVATG